MNQAIPATNHSYMLLDEVVLSIVQSRKKSLKTFPIKF